MSNVNYDAFPYSSLNIQYRKDSATGIVVDFPRELGVYYATVEIGGQSKSYTFEISVDSHDHELTYVANGTTITATCSAEGCNVPKNTATLTISAPTDLEFDGDPKACTLTKDYNTEFFPNPVIKYFDENMTEILNPVDIGSYFATVTQGDATATVEFAITGMSPMQGVGSVSNPYQITSKAQLKKFRNIVNGINGENKNYSACAILMADIDLGNVEWTPIGLSTRFEEYSGTFDGNNKKITGLLITGNANNVGLFGTVADGVIKNLEVEGSVTGGSNVGGIVGEAKGYSGKKETITGCTSNVTVVGVYAVGGIAGYISSCNVTYCRNLGNVTSTSADTVNSHAGGIVGKIYSNTNITNCYNEGLITAVYHAGGIVGANYSNESAHNWLVSNCYNVGDVVTTGGYAGGIAGYNNGTVKNCHNVGNVTTPDTGTRAARYVGGIIGIFSADANAPIDCYYLSGCIVGKSNVAGGKYTSSGASAFVGKALTADEFINPEKFVNFETSFVNFESQEYTKEC